MIDTPQIAQRLKTAEARQRLVERYPIKRYNCRQPLNRGEELVASLSGMVIQPGRYPFDFGFKHSVRVESKHAEGPRVVPYASCDGVTLQFLWSGIKPAEFDWLLLSAIHDKKWWLWFLYPSDAREFMTGGRDRGQITYTIPFAKQRQKARNFDHWCRTTLPELLAKCEAQP
jgi:hypothetical protein